MKRRIVVLGAAGRDFHSFNTCFRDSPEDHVVAFTATQIPDIAGRKYPAELAGPLYPDGIPIVEEAELERLILEQCVDLVVFSYSDISHNSLMHPASRTAAVKSPTPSSMAPTRWCWSGPKTASTSPRLYCWPCSAMAKCEEG